MGFGPLTKDRENGGERGDLGRIWQVTSLKDVFAMEKRHHPLQRVGGDIGPLAILG